MPTPLLYLVGILLWGMVAHGLVTGEVIAGARGLAANRYSRENNPLAYFLFIVIYTGIGAVAFYLARSGVD